MWDHVRDWWEDRGKEIVITFLLIILVIAMVLLPVFLIDSTEGNKIVPDGPGESNQRIVLRYHEHPVRVYEDIETGDKYLLSDRGGIVKLERSEE